MRKIVLICDECKKEIVTDNEYSENFKNIDVRIGRHSYISFLICPECMKTLDFVENDNPRELKPMSKIKDNVFKLTKKILRTKKLIQNNDDF